MQLRVPDLRIFLLPFQARWMALLLAAGLIAAMPMPGWAQPAAEEEEEVELPEPVEVERTTKDGLQIVATFYPSTEGIKAVPVLVLHEWKSDRSKYRDLALYLQSNGHAVLVPDLRGHGDSTTYLETTGRRPLVADRLRPDDFTDMVRYDLESWKFWLLDRNNERELNIEKLCIVGTEMGSVVGTYFAFSDWDQDQLANLKQGQDVSALVHISPPLNLRGLSITTVLNEQRRNTPRQNAIARMLRNETSTMILVGEAGGDAMKDATKLYEILKRSRPTVDPKDRAEKETLFFFPLETALQGEKLLNERQFQVPAYINGFIKARLVGKNDPWTDRSRP